MASKNTLYHPLAPTLFLINFTDLLRHDLLPFPPPRLKSFQPPTSAEAPLTPFLQPHDPQIIPSRGREVQERLRHFGGDGVVPEVRGGNFAVAGAGEARHGAGGVEGEGPAKDVQRFGHDGVLLRVMVGGCC